MRACRVIILEKGKPVERLGRKAIGPSASAMRASRLGWQPGRRMDVSVAFRAHQDRAEESLKAGGVDFALWALTVAALRRHAGSPTIPRCGTSAAAEGRCGAARRNCSRRLAPSTTLRAVGHKPNGLTTWRIAMKNFALKMRRFLVSEDGPTAVEYAVMLALIVIVCLTAIRSIGTNANTTFESIATELSGS
jgi:pilus assembly protein Flp/PilA